MNLPSASQWLNIIAVPSSIVGIWSVYVWATRALMWKRRIDSSRLPRIVLDLRSQLAESGFHPTTIVSVSRGGVILGGFMSECFEKPIPIYVYQRTMVYENQSSRPLVEDPIKMDLTGQHVLVVCAEFASGSTLEQAKVLATKNGAAGVRTMSLFSMAYSDLQPDFCAMRDLKSPPHLPWKTEGAIVKPTGNQ